SGAGDRSDLAGRDGGREPADQLHDAALRLLAVLPAGRGAELGDDGDDLQGCPAVRRAPDHRAGDIVHLPAADYLAALDHVEDRTQARRMARRCGGPFSFRGVRITIDIAVGPARAALDSG